MSDAARLRYVLRLGDTSLVLGQRLGEWVGHAPALEEDLGLANISLDLIGQARLLLTYAGELEGRGRDEDDLAFCATSRSFSISPSPSSRTAISGTRSCGNCSLDAFQLELYEALQQSSDSRLGRDRRQGAQGDPLPFPLQRRLAGSPG